jgi:hypothetical protein
MIKKVIVELHDGQSITAFQKHIDEREKYLVLKKCVISSIDETGLSNEDVDVLYVPWTSIFMMREELTDDPEPGARPQPEKPKTRMFRMSGTEEVFES